VWTLLIALVPLSGGTDFWSAMLRRRLAQSPGFERPYHATNALSPGVIQW